VPDLWILAALVIAVVIGATVQGTVGLGLGLVAAPVTSLIAPSLVPGVLLWLAAAYPVLTLAREWRDVDWPGLAWALPARLAGTAGGVYVVVVASQQVLGMTVSVMVLLGVALTARAVEVPVTPGSLIGAGLISGVSGTATSIGGPPFALLYQRRAGAQVRATMAAYFLVGAVLSLAGLALAGEADSEDAVVALVLLPCLVVGFAISGPLRRHVDAGRTRNAVLVVCSASAIALLVRSLFG